MIVLLSPAKTLDFSPVDIQTFSQPRLLKDSEKLVKILKKKSTASIQALMKISEKIAALNVERYRQFSIPFTTENAKPSIFAFKGDVYVGLEADDFDEQDLSFAQNHLRILSGLYGLLRPLDLMQSYRLEMGTKLKNGRYKNLYEFWGNRITSLINEDLKNANSKTVLNLASKEYFSSVNPKGLNANLVTVHFKEQRGDTLKVIAFNAKKARGAMAKQIIKYKITKAEDLKPLVVNDYIFNENLSSEADLVFVK